MIKDSFLIIFSKIFRNIISVFFVMILSRILTINQYGTYRQCFMIANLLNMVLLLGINEALLYYYRIVDKQEKCKIVTAMIVIKVISAVIVIVLLNIFSTKIASSINNEIIESYIPVISLMTVAILLSSILESLYISIDDVVFYSWFTIILYSAYYIIAAIIIIMTKNEYHIMILFIVFELIRSIYLIIKFYKKEKLQFIINTNTIKYILKFALPIGVTAVIITLNREIDKLMIAHFHNTIDFAIYNNATITLPIVEFIEISIGVVIFPKLSELYNDSGIKSAMEIFKKATLYCAMIIYPIVFIISIFGEGYILFLFGEQYIGAFSILRVYMLRLLITIGLYSNIAILINRKRTLIVTSIIGLVSNILLNIILIQKLGMVGAAIATVIVQFIIEGLIIFDVIKNSSIKLNDIFDVKKILLVLLICLISTAIFDFASALVQWNKILEFFVFGISTFALIILSYLKIGLIDKDIKNILRAGKSL